MATSFSSGRSRSTQREPPTMGKQLVNFYHLRLQVECTLFCNLQRRVRTHTVLVISLYELFDNPTTYFFVSDIKLQAMYKVIHTSNYDGHISKCVCMIGKYNQRGTIFSCNTILVHMK